MLTADAYQQDQLGRHRTEVQSVTPAFLSDVRAGRYTLIASLSADLDGVAELVGKYDDCRWAPWTPPIALADQLDRGRRGCAVVRSVPRWVTVEVGRCG